MYIIHTHHQCRVFVFFFILNLLHSIALNNSTNILGMYIFEASIYNRASCIVYLLCTSKIFKKRVKDIKVLLFLFCVINPVFA